MRRYGDDEMLSFQGEQRASTDAAVLVDIEGEELWLPRRYVEIKKTGGKFSKEIEIEMPRWLAEHRGLV